MRTFSLKNTIEPFSSRFDLISGSIERVVYPLESIGVVSAQYLGELSTNPKASVSIGADGYVVEEKQ